MDEKPQELTKLQITMLARLIVSCAILTAVGIWVFVWPPKDWTIPALIVGVCFLSQIAMTAVMRAKKARSDSR